MATLQKISPCLWFDTQAERAASHYVSIFPDSGIDAISHFGPEGFEIHGRPEGSVMTVSFRLAGQPFLALNGGPQFDFSCAISFIVHCSDQEEIDYYWEKLGADGDPEAQQCGWLADRYGLSWQIVPDIIPQLIADPDSKRSGRAMQALLQMKKLDIAALKRAHAGA